MTIKTTKSTKTSGVAKKKSDQIEDVQVSMTELEQKPISEVVPAEASQGQAPSEGQPITGRGVFAVRTMGNAVSVESAFLAEDGNVLRLPAVFPNRQYALEQVEELRQLINRHFDEVDAQPNS